VSSISEDGAALGDALDVFAGCTVTNVLDVFDRVPGLDVETY